jgi:hypothetical protein
MGDHLRAAVLPGVVLAYAVGAALQRAHGQHAGTMDPLAHWLRDSTLAVPVAVLVLAVASELAGRAAVRARVGAVAEAFAASLGGAVLYAAVMVPGGAIHQLLFPTAGPVGQAHAHASATHLTFTQLGALNASVALAVALPLLLALRGLTPALETIRAATGSRRVRRGALAGTLASAVLMSILPLQGTATAASTTTAKQVAACNATTAVRSYDIAAVNVRIPYNRWGQFNPNGMVYALQSDKRAILDWDKPLNTTADNRRLRPRPLVIRANEGECVKVTLTNELAATQAVGMPANPRASISVRGVPFDVQSSGGSHAGYNDDTTLARGQSRTHYWLAPQEGSYFFHDTATPAGTDNDGGSLSHGLYGAFVVEPAGSTWTDPRTGKALYTETNQQSGELYLDAVINPPTGRTFRETTQLAQDEIPVTAAFSFNYGSEPQSVRDAERCVDCIGEETSLSSWAYGDPALVKLASGQGPWKPRTPASAEDCGLGTAGFDADSCFTGNVTHTYKGDPVKIRYGLAGVSETHVFHMHAHQWLAEDKDYGKAGPTPTKPTTSNPAESQTIDSQTFGPTEMFTADLLWGSGSSVGTVGDSIFHCHLYPHFADGFWALLRTHDVLEDGTGQTPDGIKVSAIRPLADVDAPPAPTADNPGYPRFIPGKVGYRAPQPPLGITDGGVPATRYVAGSALADTDAAVQLERKVMDSLSGGRSKPGAPFRDPCPTGSREVTYKVSVIQTDVVYNKQGDHDTQGRILVLDADVEAILAGRKKPEPLFARVNAGDCVNWQLTNRVPNWFGDDAYVKRTQTNMFGQHIHLVKFDVLASDGSSNGWNYQQAAFSREQADHNAAIAAGTKSCVSATDCRIPDPGPINPSANSSGLAPGQTIHERWFADYELRTVFTHDHHFAAMDQNRGMYGALVVTPVGFDFRNPRTGAYLQPVNTAGRGEPVCASACEGSAVGAMVDAIGPGADDDYRDFGLAIADFVSLTRQGGNPRNPADVVHPPLAPEEFPLAHPGTVAMNYRNAPLQYRQTKNGQRVDPAYAFSSTVFGDPDTPVLQTYAGDNVRIRLIQGSQEEQHQVLIHNQKWRKEPDDPDSPMVDAVPVGVSEAFNFEVPRMSCAPGEDCRGDYLYSGSTMDDMVRGAWGILRVNGGTIPGLRPLPDNVPTAAGSVPVQSPTALAPRPATDPGQPCKPDAPVRAFDVVAMQAKITYNKAGDHDPYGLVYALASDEAEIRAGKNPQPMVLRAHEGDCIEVRLTNKLTTALLEHTGAADGDATYAAEPLTPRPMGLRVSMHPGMLRYDVRGSDGAAVGFNADSTVGPGDTTTYRWYADDVTPGEIGGANLTDFGDVRGHRHHGLFAGLVVEPRGATWTDQVTGAPLASGAAADVHVPGKGAFRENVVFFQDGLNLRDAAGAIIQDPDLGVIDPGAAAEPVGGEYEDTGEKALSYRNAPFRHRLGFEPVARRTPDAAAMASVYDSHAHGDPETPLFRAYEGDDIRYRILMGADKPRQHVFSLDGHGFKPQPNDPGGRTVGTISGINPGTAINAEMGLAGAPGDYMYGCVNGAFHRSGGLWGLMRVYPRPGAAGELSPTRLPAVDDPRAGGHPLLPLGLGSVRADVFEDQDGDGSHDEGEPSVAGVAITATADGRDVSTATSGAAGQAHLRLRAGSYGLTVAAPEGYTVSVAPDPVAVTAGESSAVRVALRTGGPLGPAGAPATGTAPVLPGGSGTPGGVVGSPPSTAGDQRRAPSAPRISSAVKGKAHRPVTATAKWRTPASTGGIAITGYQVIALRVDKNGRVLSKTLSSRLKPTARSLEMRLPKVGTYRFQVRAYNAAGVSKWSVRSNRVTGR